MAALVDVGGVFVRACLVEPGGDMAVANSWHSCEHACFRANWLMVLRSFLRRSVCCCAGQLSTLTRSGWPQRRRSLQLLSCVSPYYVKLENAPKTLISESGMSGFRREPARPHENQSRVSRSRRTSARPREFRGAMWRPRRRSLRGPAGGAKLEHRCPGGRCMAPLHSLISPFELLIFSGREEQRQRGV